MKLVSIQFININLDGHALNNEELTALQQLHGENVIEQLMNEGLKLQGKVTIEEVKYYLKVLGMEDEASYLKENLEKFIKCKTSQVVPSIWLLTAYSLLSINYYGKRYFALSPKLSKIS